MPVIVNVLNGALVTLQSRVTCVKVVNGKCCTTYSSCPSSSSGGSNPTAIILSAVAMMALILLILACKYSQRSANVGATVVVEQSTVDVPNYNQLPMGYAGMGMGGRTDLAASSKQPSTYGDLGKSGVATQPVYQAAVVGNSWPGSTDPNSLAPRFSPVPPLNSPVPQYDGSAYSGQNGEVADAGYSQPMQAMQRVEVPNLAVGYGRSNAQNSSNFFGSGAQQSPPTNNPGYCQPSSSNYFGSSSTHANGTTNGSDDERRGQPGGNNTQPVKMFPDEKRSMGDRSGSRNAQRTDDQRWINGYVASATLNSLGGRQYSW
ncbi:hypothetical protein HDU97_003728 [Phlyctochytrium planicorne]|nr:hypothetical protein HDU97_003728 [Phlyctochytrium planicorne]